MTNIPIDPPNMLSGKGWNTLPNSETKTGWGRLGAIAYCVGAGGLFIILALFLAYECSLRHSQASIALDQTYKLRRDMAEAHKAMNEYLADHGTMLNTHAARLYQAESTILVLYENDKLLQAAHNSYANSNNKTTAYLSRELKAMRITQDALVAQKLLDK